MEKRYTFLEKATITGGYHAFEVSTNMTTPKNHPQLQTSFHIPYPRGFLRLVMRFPIFFYRLHLGWLLGKRFLLLEHRGRRSGKLRYAMIEVVDYDPHNGTFVVAAAWGAQSDWYQNILAQPNVHVTVGSHRFQVTARQITHEEAKQHLLSYSVRNPFAFRQLGSWLIGQRSHDTAEIIRSFVESIPLVEFAPA